MKDHPEAPSEIFEEAFRGGFGSCLMDCACGRHCFDGANSYDWDDGELEGLRTKAQSSPDKYVELEYSCSSVVIDGKTFVMGCPCNQARHYEDWIRRHAEQIAQFLMGVRKQRLDYAEALKMADLLVNFPPIPSEPKADPGYPTQW